MELTRIRPLKLARITRTQARLARLLTQPPMPIVLDLPEGPLTLRVGLAETVPADHHAWPIRLNSAIGVLWFEPASEPLQHWLKHWIGELDPHQLPPALLAAAHQAALTPLLDALEGLLGTRLTSVSEATADGVIDCMIELWSAGIATSQLIARLGLDQTAALELAARLEQHGRLAVAGLDPRWLDVPLALTLWLGRIALQVRQWRELALGDLLLLPRQVTPDAIFLLLRQGQRALARARLDGQRLLIDTLVSVPMPDLPDLPERPGLQAADSDREPIPASINPDDLEIGVEFTLGQLQLPLRELRAIQPGYCFELPDLDRPRIRLVVNGRLIGHGELVLIDDHLGVRVTDLFTTPPA